MLDSFSCSFTSISLIIKKINLCILQTEERIWGNCTESFDDACQHWTIDGVERIHWESRIWYYLPTGEETRGIKRSFDILVWSYNFPVSRFEVERWCVYLASENACCV